MSYTRTFWQFVLCLFVLFFYLFVCLFVCLFDLCRKNDLNYKLNILGPLCLWQCLISRWWKILESSYYFKKLDPLTQFTTTCFCLCKVFSFLVILAELGSPHVRKG